MAGELTAAAASGAAALPGEGASATVARFASERSWADLPEAVRHEARRSLVNVFATALAGCHDPAVAIATEVFAPFAADRSCRVIGRRERFDMRHAASLNAMSGNVFDFDDTHLPTIIHPTAPVAPAVLALAEAKPAGRVVSGRDLLLAFALGAEIECRLGLAVSAGHYARGWHITSTCGVFGAALASARLLGLDAGRTLAALGHASAQASGLVETLGSMAKSISVGNAAANGLLAALFAARGFEGPVHPLEGPRGFLKVTGEPPDAAQLTRDLGTRWELLANTYKPYPCGVVLNPVIEACLDLHRELHAAGMAHAEAIGRVVLTGHPLLRQRTDRPAPRRGREAQVSAQHAVAMGLLTGRAGLDEFADAAMGDPARERLGARVAFVDDERFAVEAARVEVVLADDRTLVRDVAAARGSLARPLTDDDLSTKLETLARWGGSGVEPGRLLEALWSLERCDDAGMLMPLAAAR